MTNRSSLSRLLTSICHWSLVICHLMENPCQAQKNFHVSSTDGWFIGVHLWLHLCNLCRRKSLPGCEGFWRSTTDHEAPQQSFVLGKLMGHDTVWLSLCSVLLNHQEPRADVSAYYSCLPLSSYPFPFRCFSPVLPGMFLLLSPLKARTVTDTGCWATKSTTSGHPSRPHSIPERRGWYSTSR